MKKLTMIVMLAFAATTTFAQEDLVKQAKKQFGKGDAKGAIATLQPALNNGSDEEKASAWALLSDIHYKAYDEATSAIMQAQVVQKPANVDSTAMYNGLCEGLRAAIQANVYDQKPNAKGKVKPRFQSSNKNRYAAARVNLAVAGQWAYSNKDMVAATKYWGAYVESADEPLFEGEEKDPAKSQFYKMLPQIAYYAGLLAYQNKDYAKAERYAAVAAKSPEYAKDALEIQLFAKKDNCKTPADSAAYISMLQDMYKQDSSNDRLFNMINSYYNETGKNAEKLAWIEQALADNPNNRMLWAIKGEAQMNAEDLDGAIASFKKAVEVDPTFLPCIYNVGVCLNNKAMDLQNKLQDQNGRISPDNKAKVLEVQKEAMSYLEKCREMDPNHETVNWPYLLYRNYSIVLGDNDPKTIEVGKIAGAI